MCQLTFTLKSLQFERNQSFCISNSISLTEKSDFYLMTSLFPLMSLVDYMFCCQEFFSCQRFLLLHQAPHAPCQIIFKEREIRLSRRSDLRAKTKSSSEAVIFSSGVSKGERVL